MKKRMSIGTLITLMLGLMLVLILAIAIVAYNTTEKAKDVGNTLYTEYGQTQGEVNMALAYLQEVKCNLRNVLYLFSDDEQKQSEYLEALQTSEDNMYNEFDDAAGNLEEEEALELLEEARGYVDSYISDVDTCVAYLNEGKLEEAREHLLNNGVDSANSAAASITELNDLLNTSAQDEQATFVNTVKSGNFTIGIAFLIALFLMASGIAYLIKHLQKPVKKLADAAQNVALGSIHVDLPEKSMVREIEELTENFRIMVENLKNQASVIEQISQKNLCAEIAAHSEDDEVGNALVKLIQDNNTVFGNIRNATSQISMGSSQIAAASQTLAQGSTQQASAIQQIAASISDIAGKTKTNATNADEVNRIILQAKDDVTAGNDRMKEMVAAMNEINEASENIQKIIKVIDDIAFNTNILALNATVEAARAGEQGKGFAVVAEEVRNLAGRSAEASSQTAEMIEDSIHKVKRGGELAKDTAEALRVISEMIEEITGLSENIAKASNDQASATAQIDQALMQVSQVVQTNSATSEQCASASEELSGQARGLNQELAKFQLKDVVGSMPSHSLTYSEPEMLEQNAVKY
ncbi:MAG: methyl-accepting chemotaxis protein [Clostridiaceae bacterium]|nr:methyl-accepting chemotaxis protein [Clostridiaceae bacterium]